MADAEDQQRHRQDQHGFRQVPLWPCDGMQERDGRDHKGRDQQHLEVEQHGGRSHQKIRPRLDHEHEQREGHSCGHGEREGQALPDRRCRQGGIARQGGDQVIGLHGSDTPP